MQTETQKNQKTFDLKERTVQFSIQLIKFLQTLDNNYIYQTIGRQFLRSGTSVGANIIEAQAASSKKDFAHYYSIALKSANETKYWFYVFRKSQQGIFTGLDDLEKEIGELANIIAKCLLTLKGKKF